MSQAVTARFGQAQRRQTTHVNRHILDDRIKRDDDSIVTKAPMQCVWGGGRGANDRAALSQRRRQACFGQPVSVAQSQRNDAGRRHCCCAMLGIRVTVLRHSSQP